MSWLHTHPRFQEFFHRHGLRSAEDFLQLPGVILCGHADRHVLHVELGEGETALRAFLKKEHRISWRLRLASYRAGFGLVSRSAREAEQLERLRQAGVEGPLVLAVGEASGQAFLLLREHEGMDLRSFLTQRTGACRLGLAESLGRSLADMHAAGFVHPDLFAKHILVSKDSTWRFCFLDWQRGRGPSRLSEAERFGNLAALDASLAGVLANRAERLTCLRAYLQSWRGTQVDLATARRFIGNLSRKCARQSRLREQRQPALPRGQQNLIWLDGERLCVTRQFQEELGHLLPELWRESTEAGTHGLRVGPGRTLPLVRGHANRFWNWLGCILRGRKFRSPELEQAATIFRLERHGIAAPRLLAVGETFTRPWKTAGFLLTEPAPFLVPLRQYLEWADVKARRHVLVEAGALLRRLHEAGLRVRCFDEWAMREDSGLQVLLESVQGLVRARSGFRGDLQRAREAWWSCCTPTDLLCFRLGYEGRSRRAARRKPAGPGADARQRRASA